MKTRVIHDVGYDLKLALPLAGFFLVFFITPLILLIFVSLHADPEMERFGFVQFRKFLSDPYSLKVLGQTLLIGAETTALCLLLGFPLAWLFARSPGWLRSVLILIILLPLLTSVVVRTFAWIVILGRLGIVNSALISLGLIDTPLRLLYSVGGLVFALAQVHMPLMVLPLITALSRIDPNLADASAALGAGAWRTFLRITLPLTLAGIIAGCLLTYCLSLTAFITQTLIGGGQMLLMPGYIYQQATATQDWPFAAAISVIFLVAVLTAVTVFNLLGRLAQGVERG
ncbi:MAG: ABC transporter permease [Xanthobacteraceae bacterium]|jgi:putative spermidine/putrescine transport system permease protein